MLTILSMFTDVSSVLNEIETQAATLHAGEIRARLRQLSLDDFAEVLLNMPNPGYPKISAALPAMASDEVQRKWTGDCGITLLRQSVAFVRAVWHSYERSTGQRLADARILDYGCGYGRLLRLMMYFVDDSRLFGCDPWSSAIKLCKQSGITSDLQLTDCLPLKLPYVEASFDLIYAFSVFTHLSLRAATTAFGALATIISPGGLLAITFRPVEFWRIHPGKMLSNAERSALETAHEKHGFAFRPHRNQQPVDGDITFGDASMTLEFMARTFAKWTILGTERNLVDPYQRIAYLRLRP